MFVNKLVDDMTSNEARAAGNKCFHGMVVESEENVELTLKCPSSILKANLRVNPARKATTEAAATETGSLTHPTNLFLRTM